MKPSGSALVKLPKSTPFHLLPLHLRFTFTAAVCETVPQGSSSPLCSTEFSVQAEFSREDRVSRCGTKLESSVSLQSLYSHPKDRVVSIPSSIELSISTAY